MLQRLCIRNIALIEELEMEFGEGLHVLTGETGAGKSILIDAVNLVLGERGRGELIRYGAQKARVEAEFSVPGDNAALLGALSDNGLESEDGMLILSRELTASGKSVCRVNGALVTLSTLRAVSEHLVDIHGQHAHQALLDPQKHLRFLDACAGAAQLAPLKRELGEAAAEYRALLKKSSRTLMSDAERERERDLLLYQIQEIEAAGLSAQEEGLLEKERALLANAERIMAALEESYAAFHDEAGLIRRLREAQRSMGDIAGFSGEYAALAARMEEAYYGIEDMGFALRDSKNALDFDAGRLEQVEERLDLIARLKRKYGQSVEAVLAYCREAQDKLYALDNAAAEREAAKKQLAACTKRYEKAAAALSELRKAAAEKLAVQMHTQLAEVGMPKAVFQTEFARPEKPAFDAEGEDRVEFLLSANPGEPCKPLARVASGGELSRVMLAFKTILAGRDAMPTLIFDEIDTGISGRMALLIGEKMRSIAENHQVFCVTHLPQIAAMAHMHYLVEKTEAGAGVRTGVRLLDEAGCIERLAVMMGGEADSTLAQAHAREMLESLREADEKGANK